MLRALLLRNARSYLDKAPAVKRLAVRLDRNADLIKHAIATAAPFVIRPTPRVLTVAITAACNYRCTGCRYGRDFMPGASLKLDLVRTLLDDAASAGMTTVRIYGGEPLLHPDLCAMIQHARKVGMLPYVTTNGFLLERKIKSLYAAGLRIATIGYYGSGSAYNDYTARQDAFEQLSNSIAAVRRYCGADFKLQLNYLLMRSSCSVEDLHRAWEFACTYGMNVQIDLIHYSLPYFTEGPDRELQFTPADEPKLRIFADELLKLKACDSSRIPESQASIRSIPDWALKGPAMRIPCDAYNMIWVGADGTVQLCYVTFPLGNLHQDRLRDLMYTRTHSQAARDCFQLNCPNCHCERSTRIAKHIPSLMKYRA